MNIENLKIGQVIKNYKEMCVLLGECESAGNSKKSQLKEWERYFNYHKQGNKFVVDEIYDNPKEKIDNRVNNGNIFGEDLEKLLIHMMSKSEKYHGKVQLSVNAMLCQLAIVNPNFSVGRNNMSKFSRYTKIPIESFYDFYNNTYKKVKDAVERALNKLDDRCLIKWQYITKVCTKDYEYRPATDRELKIIANTEYDYLGMYKVETKKDLFLRGKWNDWKKDVNKSLAENEGILYYFKAFDIITTDVFERMLLEESEKEYIEVNVNSNVKDSCIATAEGIQEKFKHKYLGSPRIDREKNRVSSQYVEDTKQIIMICIDRKQGLLLENELSNVENKKFTYSERKTGVYDILASDLLDEFFG